jgi:very-short-patch-repair endonuclease
MAANRTQLQNALHKPYDRLLFSREVLNPVFGSGFSLFSSPTSAAVSPNKSESTVIDQVKIYGKILLDDSTEITCYEVLLQPKVRIEQSKVAIQQYVRKLLTAGQGALINFVSPSTRNVWRLTLVAKDSDVTESGVKEKITNAKRYTFLLGPSETCRTAAERFEMLSTEKEITFQLLKDAFSVEKLSKAFFDEYTLHYQNFCDYLQESNYRKSVFNIDFPNNATKEQKDKASKPIRDFVKKLLGRIVFLYFVQKKGWLGASDTDYTDGAGDFIRQLFFESGGNETFYSNWLTVLFFDTLNKKRANDDFTMPDGKRVKVPFLNGGLFDMEEFDGSLLTFPPALFHHPDFEDVLLTKKNAGYARGFLDFLDAFNFTVYEDSPDDHTVAVDPEMLGHIFENLLEDNKDKGAFYTPKEIVHYMCQESLIEYLKNSPPAEGWQTQSDGVANSPDDTQMQSDGVASTATKASIPFRNAKNYFSLPYNPNLKKRARLLRKAGNLSEVLFWNRVKNKQFKGFDFDRQKVIGNYIVDFYCTNTNVVVEIDGSSHDNKQEYDRERDEYLQSLGLTVIHIPVKDVMKNIEGVMQMLYNHPAMKQPAVTHAEEKPPLTPPKEGNGKEEGKVRRLVKEKAAIEFSIEELEYIDQLLDNVKICDPAIGSGAFPMGLLHEILSLKELIAYETGKAWNPAEAKLNIIQNSIYGVDIEKGAVDIARLRFWLSLVIDEEKPKPLPNLDYKIVVGDSLISRFDGEIIEIDWERRQSVGEADQYVKNVQKLLKEVSKMQKQYFSPDNADKEKIRNDIRRLKIELLINQLSFNKELYLNKTAARGGFLPSAADMKYNTERELEIKRFDNLIDKLNSLLKHPDEPFHHFDWKLDFPEVLNPYLVPDENQRGFDIVIGNPPYVSYYSRQAVKIDDYYLNILKSKSSFITDISKKGRYHSVQFFLDRQIKLMKNNAVLFNIIDLSFFEAPFIPIRGYLLKKVTILEIIANLNVFENVASGQLIIGFKNKKPSTEHQVKWKNNFDKTPISIQQDIWTKNSSYTISFPKSKLINNIEACSKSLISYCDVKVGVNIGGVKEYFMKNDPKYYPFINGSNNVQPYEIIFPSGKQKKDGLMYFDFNKKIEKKIWDERIGTPSIGETNERFLKPKIVIRQSDIRLTATYDEKGYHCDYNLFTANRLKNSHLELKYILSIINSKLMTYYVLEKGYLNIKPGKTPQIRVTDIKKLPIKEAKNQIPFIRFVDYILFLKQFKRLNSFDHLMPIYFEQLIDGMVYELYFPELIEKYDCEIIKYLGELPEFTESMSDEEKMEICKTVYDRLNDAAHPVRIHLEKMKKEIPEIRIIEGLEN